MVGLKTMPGENAAAEREREEEEGPDAGEPGHFRFKEEDLRAKDGAIGAVIAHVLARPDGIRARAQVSATISAGSAAALAAFGSLTGLSERDEWLRWLVVAAVSVWLVSLLLYLIAISRSAGARKPPTVNAMLDDFRAYASVVRRWVRYGTYATVLAITVTLVAAIALAHDSITSSPERPVTVLLHTRATASLTALCGDKAGGTLSAKVRPDDLSRVLVPLRMRCRTRQPVTVLLRRRWILAARVAE